MRIECPACTAVYELPDHLLNNGPRALRCAACGKTWSLSSGAPAETASQPAREVVEPPVQNAVAGPAGDRNFAALMAAVTAASDDSPARRQGMETDRLQVGAAADRSTDADPERGAAPEAGLAEATGLPMAAMAATTADSMRPRPSFGLILAWIATLGGIGSLVMAFALFPQGVVARWPAAARLYEAVGISIGAS